MTIVSIALLFFTGGVIYSLNFLFQCKNCVETKMKNISSDCENISSQNREIIYAAINKEEINSYVGSCVLREIYPDVISILKRKLYEVICVKFIKFYYTEKEILSLWCYWFPFKDGHGLNSASNFYFDRDFSDLKTNEKIEMLARMYSPSYYDKHPDKLNQRINKIRVNYRRNSK